MPSVTLRPGGDAKALQERLHELLSRLADTTDLVKGWPESGDDASTHVETTSSLIASIYDIVKAIQKVEGVLKNDEILSQKLQNCPIPLDLLDLMECANGLNPECFTRGLLREALTQLAGLRRRKVALEMLGTAIQSGLQRSQTSKGTKREREGSTEESQKSLTEPPKKKMHTEPKTSDT